MAIIVKPINDLFKLVVLEGDDKVTFFFKQLDYKTKAHITGLTTKVQHGQVMIDSQMTCFYNIKYGLRKVEGIEGLDGKPYELAFEGPDKKALSDECVDEILATPLSDKLIFSARELSKASYPNKVLHPVTQEPIEGIEVIPAHKAAGQKK